jgi:carboxyl-terminal processing protease
LDGLIIDNRFNEGGASTVFSKILGLFTSGPVGYYASREETVPLRIIGENIGGSQDVPLVVLVGRDTISYGEIFSGILQDLGRATLIGETTDGNVEILWAFEFSDHSRAWIAHDAFRPLNNSEQDWEQSGIIPDQAVSAAWDEITQENDPLIQAALAHFDAQ